MNNYSPLLERFRDRNELGVSSSACSSWGGCREREGGEKAGNVHGNKMCVCSGPASPQIRALLLCELL